MTDRAPNSADRPYASATGTTNGVMTAQSALVNRTHRVVRERARIQSDRRSRAKSLWIPLAICSALLLVISTSAWNILAQNDLSPTGIPDASDQMLVFLLWFFPVSAALLAMVWFNRSRTSQGNESTR